MRFFYSFKSYWVLVFLGLGSHSSFAKFAKKDEKKAVKRVPAQSALTRWEEEIVRVAREEIRKSESYPKASAGLQSRVQSSFTDEAPTPSQSKEADKAAVVKNLDSLSPADVKVLLRVSEHLKANPQKDD